MTGFMTEDHQDITGKREGSFDRNVFHGTSSSLRAAITGRSDRGAKGMGDRAEDRWTYHILQRVS